MNTVEVIEWLDSNGRARWGSKDEYLAHAAESMTVWSVGYVYYETDDRIALAQSTTDSAMDGSIVIPKAAIVSRSKVWPR